MIKLETTEVLRYLKQMQLPEVGMNGQQRIKQASVAVIGAGGLGCPVLQYLVAAGVGRVGIFDPDRVEVSNLHRQILFTTADVGRSKVAVAIERLQAQNPHCNLVAHPLSLTAHNTDLLLPYDLVIDGCDNFATRYVVNDACVSGGKPLVYGSILGEEGQVAVFNLQGSKNLRHIFPDPPLAGDVPDCSENGVLGTVPGIVGAIMAHTAIHIILQRPVMVNQYLLLNTLTMERTVLQF
ncbi:adenylyltransferase and sulfurtransferase [Chitinophaga costaii]|uniref:Adenylyltransferase and sulfurtransferase n=1 Tax=Chitinophaga costaii TaxID=1335309 RepID=A0A1C4FN14_9BACT|nr:HesA/MoeB/ThiF family protein [Chitinophaga costaii]PUZ29955.1 HesA/MoeB/ThiF family protein [Chitinophaga costaii]SCC56921.1 adenylyltransferase and sulfurtransferase [Chitinophaga costaii]